MQGSVKMRIRATKNVAKITNVMKLVSSSKLKGVEEQLFRGRAFGESILSSLALEPTGKAKKDEDATLDLFVDPGTRHLCVAITTDRGLCGAVNSSLCRALRKELAAAAKAKASVRLFTVGDKGRLQIAKDYSPLMTRSVDACFDKDPVFALAAAVAAKIVSEPYDVLTLWYNHYENQAKFVNTYKQIPQLAALKAGAAPAKLAGYEIEPLDNSETLMNLQEYGIACALYYAMLETAACETSQRVMAMDNATTNAKDMVHGLGIIYNRARQAKITTELAEIIGGAAAQEGQVVVD